MDYPVCKNSNFSTFFKQKIMLNKPFSSINSISKQYFQILKKTMDYPLCKNSNFSTFFKKKIMLNKPFSSIKSISKQYFSAYFGQKPSMEKILIFDHNHGLTPLQKFHSFFTFLKRNFNVKESLLFYLEYQQTKPKPYTNSFAKIATFQLFEVLVFIA